MFASKMTTTFIKSPALFILLLFLTSCKAQLDREEEEQTSGAHGEGGGAFFALRSCHQLLRGDSGEFFSPDYVCANPSLWCNWTIQVDSSKRVQLHLEDLTPDDACHLKQDQIHVDDPAGRSGSHRVLQKCWREAKYTSSSRTVHVVLLIGGWPAQQYRGFYGHYRAFGPPVAYHPRDGVSETDMRSTWSYSLEDLEEFGPMVAGGKHPTPAATPPLFDYSDKAVDSSVERTAHAEPPSSEKDYLMFSLTVEPTVPTSSHGTFRSERGIAQMLSDLPAPNRLPSSSLHTPMARRRDVNEGPVLLEGPSIDEDTGSEPSDGAENEMAESDQQPSFSEEVQPEELERTHLHPIMVEPLSDHRGNMHVRNSSGIEHRPGDQLFEVAVEVRLSHNQDQDQVHMDGSLMKSIKALVLQHLDGLHVPLTLTFKRIKRLHAGELYIIWLNTGPDGGSRHVYASVHSDLQGLVGTSVSLMRNLNNVVIASVSIGDVNECGTQLALCDINADCLDQFGSYWCRCKAGFRDESRLGPGGTVCVDEKAAGDREGCSGGPSAETKGVYIVFFLLTAFIILLLVAACTLYRRHHHGAFLLHCSSKGDPSQRRHDDGYSCPPDSDLPPPPLPTRGPRDGWALQKERRAAADVPLLRFSALRPSDSYTQPQEADKI
ncbi:uncharacterized protein zgc:66455 isoform X2 [Dunckerocampus dactyliophorus]|uniref:uncharacterized protein zgc:66455 isoform X2 n=1 Tax=Dunckerocampus dactyliophorus TaxID=161453 RepID=UPI0024052D5A|nr:uncharacterized protein zgc:66455 isoform X2 [Dunckerocampus dactyliophorus]